MNQHAFINPVLDEESKHRLEITADVGKGRPRELMQKLLSTYRQFTTGKRGQ